MHFRRWGTVAVRTMAARTNRAGREARYDRRAGNAMPYPVAGGPVPATISDRARQTDAAPARIVTFSHSRFLRRSARPDTVPDSR